MKQTDLTKAAEEVVAFKLKAIDKLIEEVIDPLADVGNPEKIMKKPFEQWTPEDLQKVTMIYGTSETSPLANLIFRKTLERVEKLESEVV